jgi:transcriptional regulator with XRE-family HTH domain
MLSDTLQEGLSAYGIGPKIRSLRLKRSMGLVALGEHTGLSPALLSKIERGLLHPTLPTLLRIALVFSVGLDFFFGSARERPVMAIVRRKARVRLPEGAAAGDPAYAFESLDFPVTERRMNAYYAEFLPVSPEKQRLHEHTGAELLFVITGTLLIRIDGGEVSLSAGDSMYFDSSVPHAYRRRGASACRALVVTSA